MISSESLRESQSKEPIVVCRIGENYYGSLQAIKDQHFWNYKTLVWQKSKAMFTNDWKRGFDVSKIFLFDLYSFIKVMFLTDFTLKYVQTVRLTRNSNPRKIVKSPKWLWCLLFFCVWTLRSKQGQNQKWKIQKMSKLTYVSLGYTCNFISSS